MLSAKDQRCVGTVGVCPPPVDLQALGPIPHPWQSDAGTKVFNKLGLASSIYALVAQKVSCVVAAARGG